MGYNKKRSSVFNAKWAGTCGKCGQSWEVGTPLVYEFGKVVHDVCPKQASGEVTTFNIKSVFAKGGAAAPKPLLTTEQKVFVPSIYQQSIFDWITDPKKWAKVNKVKKVRRHGVVEAVAGSGKTTTIVEALKLIPSTMRVLFLAYNRHIVAELKDRLIDYPNITVATTHSFGLSVIRKSEYFDRRDGVDEEKLNYIMDDFWSIKKYVKDPTTGEEVEQDVPLRTKHKAYRSAMRSIVELAKGTMLDYHDMDAVLSMVDRYGINLEEEDETIVLDRLVEVMDRSIENISIVDYDDMIYLPVVHKAYEGLFEQYDFVMVDETQDLNKCQVELILKALAPDGRVLAVGDRKQSLYGFRGADVDAIPNLIKRLDAQVLPLSISYRCPSSHVDAVKGIVPQIESAPGAKVGILGEVQYKELLPMLREGDMVLCRTNAPLVKPAFNCIKRGIKAIIRGKDIGKELVNYIERFNCDDLGQLEILMNEFVEKQMQKLIDNGKELAADNVWDKHTTILTVMEECRTVVDLKNKINTLFSDSKVGVVFSSIHRAKGLEAERVFILNRDQMPHPKAKEDWEKEQEQNIIYVAGTRSKDELYTVIGDAKDLDIEVA